MFPPESTWVIVPGLNVSRGKSKTLNPARAAICAKEANGGVCCEFISFLVGWQPQIHNATIEIVKSPTRILGSSPTPFSQPQLS
jgi:hypothetical protein